MTEQVGLLGRIGNFFVGGRAFGDPLETARRNAPVGLLETLDEEQQRELGERLQSQFRTPFRSRSAVRQNFRADVTSLAESRQEREQQERERQRRLENLERFSTFVDNELRNNPDFSQRDASLALNVARTQGVDAAQNLFTEQANVSAGATRRNAFGDEVASQPTITQQDAAAGLDVKRSFNAIDTRTNEPIGTVVETDRGLFQQRVNDRGEIERTPLDARFVREISTTVQGSQDDTGTTPEDRKFRDAEVAVRDLTATANDALELIDRFPDINTFAARAAGLVNGLQQNVSAFARSLGLEFDQSQLDPSSNKVLFDELGVQNARMRSLIQSLAFQAAAASAGEQKGRSVSNEDIKRFIREVGADSSDPRAISLALRDVVQRSQRRLGISSQVRGFDLSGELPEVLETRFTAFDSPAAGAQNESQGRPRFSSQAEAEAAFERGDIRVGDKIIIDGRRVTVRE